MWDVLHKSIEEKDEEYNNNNHHHNHHHHHCCHSYHVTMAQNSVLLTLQSVHHTMRWLQSDMLAWEQKNTRNKHIMAQPCSLKSQFSYCLWCSWSYFNLNLICSWKPLRHAGWEQTRTHREKSMKSSRKKHKLQLENSNHGWDSNLRSSISDRHVNQYSTCHPKKPQLHVMSKALWYSQDGICLVLIKTVALLLLF